MTTMVRCLFVLTCFIMHMLRNMSYIAIYGMHMDIKSASEYG